MSTDGNVYGFVDLVARMRIAQKRWFKYRNLKALEQATTLERQVDQWIDRETAPRVRPALFNRPERGE